MTSNPRWTDRHGSTVAASAPAVPDLDDEERAAVWRQVEAAAGRRRPRRSRWRAVTAAVVVVASVGVAGAAVGNVFSAHTGRGPVDAEDVELGGPGERLDPRAPDFAAVLDEITGDIRFPTPQTRRSALTWEVDDLSADAEGAIVSTGALRLWTAGHAVCAWSNAWAVALRAGDDTGESEAAGVILGARHWPSITDTDPDLADESEFAWLPGLERAVRADDPAAARRALFGHIACMPGLAPELGLGRRW